MGSCYWWASALLNTAVDLTNSVTGVFTKPITEYRDDRDRRLYEESNAESSKAGSNRNKASNDSQTKPDDASVETSHSDPTSKRKGVSAGHLAGASERALQCSRQKL